MLLNYDDFLPCFLLWICDTYRSSIGELETNDCWDYIFLYLTMMFAFERAIYSSSVGLGWKEGLYEGGRMVLAEHNPKFFDWFFLLST